MWVVRKVLKSILKKILKRWKEWFLGWGSWNNFKEDLFEFLTEGLVFLLELLNEGIKIILFFY